MTLNIALIWGTHQNDEKFHTHHSFWEAAIEGRTDTKVARYLWTELDRIPKGLDLYFFVDYSPLMYTLPMFGFKNTAFFMWDAHHTSSAVLYQGFEYFDRVYLAERISAITAREYGYPVSWLPPAFHPGLFRPLDVQKVHDYAFIGQMDGVVYRSGDTKRSLLSKVGAAPGLHGYVGTGVYGDRVNQIYNESRILFERTIFASIGTRFFELIGSGGFTLMNRMRQFSGIEHVAEDGIHYASYDDTFDDLERKMRYYLQHDEERDRIAKAGHKHFSAHHTYAARFERILRDFNLT